MHAVEVTPLKSNKHFDLTNADRVVTVDNPKPIRECSFVGPLKGIKGHPVFLRSQLCGQKEYAHIKLFELASVIEIHMQELAAPGQPWRIYRVPFTQCQSWELEQPK